MLGHLAPMKRLVVEFPRLLLSSKKASELYKVGLWNVWQKPPRSRTSLRGRALQTGSDLCMNRGGSGGSGRRPAVAQADLCLNRKKRLSPELL
ncbi:hypothetical protein NDU88_000991 [Pleurodeles waltl]|uniref:Uncharacterized protein n=1 Tax=Pleurodeles waltl TaxID=8319 RepID=A0AAV7P2J0_PLEWA|nr:hypothetical protein NDU88_000991 [Pleurodeles waltl]